MCLMADFKFPILTENVFTGSAHRACRNAVLWPLAGAKPVGDVAAAFDRLRSRWYGRLCSLRDAGFKPFQVDEPVGQATKEEHRAARNAAKTQLQYARNCPPFSVKTSKVSRPCNRAKVCPFCYAREIVLEHYKALAFAAFNLIGPNRLARVNLLAVRTVMPVVRIGPKVATPAKYVNAAITAKWADYNKLKTVCPVAGARMGLTMEPGPEANTLVVTRSMVAIIPVDVMPPDFKGKIMLHGDGIITAGGLSKLVSFAFKYPMGMMRGDAATAVSLLTASTEKRAKLTAAMGLCDNGGIRTRLRALFPPTQIEINED